MKIQNYLSGLLLLSTPAFAQEQVAETAAVSHTNIYLDILIVVFILATLVLLGVSVVLLNTFKAISKELLKPTPFVAAEAVHALEYEDWLAAKKQKPGMLNKVLGLRPISEEKDLKLEHEFDGIAELDNPTPAWFMWLFYTTIVFACCYLLTYHVFDWGKLQEEEYVAEVQEADAAREAYLAKAANLIDENSVKESNEAGMLSAGKAVFTSNCVACHGDKGQGVVGPNLTDEYWLHGGGIHHIFKTIKYGVPEKGMISWEKTLTPKQISEVSNYILSLKGSSPANAKAPQGEKEG